ncbi:MAG: hydrogenase formation protein HypD [Sulfolobales archaeon]|nr:hydrogenase formation protein HypD [Sulfolobales archaeon]MCX8208588.1 hydrogenase formation protein HypD [Sulfolobales archaeon]MDW8010466.1 hydrogenase formation protein HypD [Sulfolobales archaeon]
MSVEKLLKSLESEKIVSAALRLIGEYLGKLRSRGEVPLKIMNFCGTHEWTAVRYGVRSLLPEEVELVAGPGCPVCVTPGSIIEYAVELSLDGVRVYTFGDAFRAPATSLKTPRNLAEARAQGADVRVVYSFLDAIQDAKKDGRESVFLGIGFETTAPLYAIPLRNLKVPRNLKLLSALRLTPPIMRYVVKLYRERGLLPIRGVVAPGHVSTVIGASAWEFLPREFGIATAVSGFDGVDLLVSIAEIVRMVADRSPELYNEYRRVVKWEGNPQAKAYVGEVFEEVDSAWRGIGYVPKSGLKLREKYGEFDAYEQYGLKPPGPEKYVLTSASESPDLPPACRCGEVVLGIAKPTQCPMFMKACTPSRPYGPCMVSQEGTCYIWFKYGSAELYSKMLGEVPS